MNKIKFYKYNGDFDYEEELNNDNIVHTNRALIKCYLKNGKVEIGYADPYRTHDKEYFECVTDFIYLWTWTNLDEESHQLIGDDSKYDQTFKKVNVSDIVGIDVKLFSNPKWGGKLTNKF